MGLFDKIKRIPKINVNSLKTISEEFNPDNKNAKQPNKEQYGNANLASKDINSAIDKLREMVASNNEKLADLTKINSNISSFFDKLFSDPDLTGKTIDIEHRIKDSNGQEIKEIYQEDIGISDVEQKLKIVEMFSNIFSKYDENTANTFVTRLINSDQNDKLIQDVKYVLKDWRNQYDHDKREFLSYENKDVFAERIIEASEKYDIQSEYKQALKKHEVQEKQIKQYTVKSFDFKGDDLMSMFLTNPIVEKLMIDPVIISLHRVKDAVIDSGTGMISNMKEQNNYYNNYTSEILDLFTNENIQTALKLNLTEPAKDEKGNIIFDANNNPKTQYDVFISEINKINSLPDNIFGRFKKNKQLKALMENSNFYISTNMYRKDATNYKLNQNQQTNADEAYGLLKENLVNRSVNFFSEEFAEILFAATRNCKNKKQSESMKDLIYTIGAMDPSLLGEKEDKIKEILSFRKKMRDHDYKKKYNTPLEQKYLKDMQNKINKDYVYEIENMKSIERDISDIGRRAKEKNCIRKSSRVESRQEFIDKIDRLINGPNTKLNDKEDLEDIKKLINEYKALYKTTSKAENAEIEYSEYLHRTAGRTR